MLNPQNESIQERINAAATEEGTSFESYVANAVLKALEKTERTKSQQNHQTQRFIEREGFSQGTFATAGEEIHCHGCGGRIREGSKYLIVSGWNRYNFHNFPRSRKYNIGNICEEAGISGMLHWSYPPKNKHFCELHMDTENLQQWERARKSLLHIWRDQNERITNAMKAWQMVDDYLRNPNKNQLLS